MKYILSLDQGTTSTRAILFDKHGNACYVAAREIACTYPFSGWVETDALAIWISVIDVINEVLVKSNLTMKDIETIGITNQRETTVIFDKKTGLPVYPAIVWQSRQSVRICNKFARYRNMIHQKTGLRINSYFSASKIRFILDKVKNGQKRAENGELLFGTIDTWIIYRLTNFKVHATDVSNASRTMIFNLNDKCWDQELLDLFNIPKVMLPEVFPSSHLFGHASFFSGNVPITGVAGDQQAALFGQMCLSKGELKNTYGTGCFLLMNIGEKPIFSHNGLLTTIAWEIDGKVTYALEGSVFVGGASVQWLRDQMEIIKTSDESEELAMKADKDSTVYVVPAFVGLGTPYWDDKVRGAVLGLTRASDKHALVRATLESIAYQSKDVIEVMKKDTGIDFTVLKVDGGATKNNYLMQFQADILNVELKLPCCLETTALGVAYLAGLYVKYWKNITEIKKIHRYQKELTPKMSETEIKKKYKGWKKAVKATRLFRV